jgi:lipoyl(octanoyl) transferase
VAELWVAQLGTIPYRDGVELQETLRARRQAGDLPDLLLVLEHPPVYTKGRRTEAADLPMGEDWYRAQGIEVCDTDRGGRVTYHGPGQLVAYPIMAVERVADFVHTMRRSPIRRSTPRCAKRRSRACGLAARRSPRSAFACPVGSPRMASP